MTVERVNPAVILKAAQLAISGEKNIVAYLKSDGSNEVRIQKGYTAQMKSDREFNPLTSDADAMKLERALKREGWHFGPSFEFENQFYGAGPGHDVIHDDSDTLLLLKAVASQFSIPLYTESK